MSPQPVDDVPRPARFTLMAPGWMPPRHLITQALGLCFTSQGLVVMVSWDGDEWTIPGTVEEGETVEQALVREIAEELGCAIGVTGWLAGEAPIGETHLLTVAVAHLVSGDPVPREHDLVRWLAADDLDSVDWLEPDRPFLPELRTRMGERMGP